VLGFVPLGIEHMLLGWDHILFIGGVVLLAGEWRRAAKLITVFVGRSSGVQPSFWNTSISVEPAPIGARKLASRLHPRVLKRSTQVWRGIAAG
jgi:hypothetical protein